MMSVFSFSIDIDRLSKSDLDIAKSIRLKDIDANTLSIREVVSLHFHREASSREEAIESAIRVLKSVGFSSEHIVFK